MEGPELFLRELSVGWSESAVAESSVFRDSLGLSATNISDMFPLSRGEGLAEDFVKMPPIITHRRSARNIKGLLVRVLRPCIKVPPLFKFFK